MLSRAQLLVSSGLGRFKPPRLTIRNMSEKPKDSAIKFKVGGKQEIEVIDVQSEANKAYNFFSTLKGQKLVGGMWVAGSALGALWHIAPHWFLLDRVKGIYQSYTNGSPTKLKEEMLDLMKEVTVDMKLSESEINSLDVFVLTMSEPFAWGELGEHGLIGFPEYYYWQEKSDVPIEQMRFGSNHDTGANTMLSPAQLESEAASSFSSSLLLSTDAKKFSIAREMERMKLQPYGMHGSFSFTFILLTYNISRVINKKLELFKKPPVVRGIAYVGLLPTMVLSYFLVRDTYNRHVDKELDRRAAQISPVYAAGGVKYYDTMLQRNIALRELEGDRGKSKYTGKGDLVEGIVRFKQASIHDRRDVCKSYL